MIKFEIRTGSCRGSKELPLSARAEPPGEHEDGFTTWTWQRAFDSSFADRLHDLAKNSMDSVGVSGGGHIAGSQLASLSSSMFSSLFDLNSKPPEHLNTVTVIKYKNNLVSSCLSTFPHCN